MHTPRPHPSWIILAALALAGVIDLIHALPGSPDNAPEQLAVGWSLTPTDFVLLGSHQKGLWSAKAPQAVITRDDALRTWLPKAYQDDLMLESAPGGWLDLDFPTLASTPQLATAQVFIAPSKTPTQREPCDQVGTMKFQCSPKGWAYVGSRVIDIQKKKTSCIWAHPIPKHTTTILYPALPAPPKDKQFQLEVAFHDDVIRDKPSPVVFTATHGAAAQNFTALNNRLGWQRFKIQSGKEAAPLKLEIMANKPGRHQLCYRLELIAKGTK